MLNKTITIFLVALFSCAAVAQDRIIKKADKELSKFYKTTNFVKNEIVISESSNLQTPTNFKEGSFFRILSNEQFLGYGYLGSAMGKAAKFDYLVLFDDQFIITKTKVLIYREEYGGEIGSKRWLKQFEGKASSSKELMYNEDIIPISGATVSVQAMTKAMNDLLKSISILQDLKEI
jgi:hypothetical protein